MRSSQTVRQSVGNLVVLLVVVILILSVLGCAQYRMMVEDRQFPTNPQFSIIPQGNENKAKTNLDFTALYTPVWEQDERECKRMKDRGYTPYHNCLRFWSNGRVMSRPVKNITGHPKREDGDSFSQADLGYYIVDGTNVTIELFEIHEDSMFPSRGYTRYYGVLDGWDILVVTWVEQRGWLGVRRGPVRNVFRRVVLGGMKREPDW